MYFLGKVTGEFGVIQDGLLSWVVSASWKALRILRTPEILYKPGCFQDCVSWQMHAHACNTS